MTGEREVAILGPAVPALHRRLVQAEAKGQPWLFPGRVTRAALSSKWAALPMGQDRATRGIAAARVASGVDLRPYDLRHLCASALIAADATPLEVAEAMGHEDDRITQRVDADAWPSRVDALRGKLNALYGDGSHPKE